MEDMYQENIIDHYKNPKNFGEIENPSSSFEDVNPSCGDKIKIYLLIENNKIKDLKFNGNGCAISQASVSMMTQYLKGKDVNDVISFNKENILELLGIEISPIRLKCALLGLKVFKMALYKHIGKEISSEEKKELD